MQIYSMSGLFVFLSLSRIFPLAIQTVSSFIMYYNVFKYFCTNSVYEVNLWDWLSHHKQRPTYYYRWGFSSSKELSLQNASGAKKKRIIDVV